MGPCHAPNLSCHDVLEIIPGRRRQAAAAGQVPNTSHLRILDHASDSFRKQSRTSSTVECSKSTASIYPRRIDEFLKEAENLLLGPLAGDGLLELSNALKAQFRDKLQTSMACMLPSYNHQLPAGHEVGQYLALDVGGSTLRIALVELRGRGAKGRESEIVRLSSFVIDADIRNLEGMAFFDWMAERILETICKDGEDPSRPMPVAVSWSFPIE